MSDKEKTNTEIKNKNSGPGDQNGISGTGGQNQKPRSTFDQIVADLGIDRAIAKGVRATVTLPANEEISETDFIRALKNFTGQVPG